MRALWLAGILALATPAATARADGLGFVYVTANVGKASGGHAALVADGNVYHLQNSDGLLLLVREGWSAFHLVYSDLENRPLVVARVDAPAEVTEQVQGAFSKLFVEQELALARRESLRDDQAWLEAAVAGDRAPALRGAGLVDPESPGDPDALALRAVVRARAGSAFLGELAAGAEREIQRLAEAGHSEELESLREALLLREAARALDRGYGLDPGALAALGDAPPLAPAERTGLEILSQRLEQMVGELVQSTRPDRGYALLLAQARYLAARRSLAANRLFVLDALAGAAASRSAGAEPVPVPVRERRRAQATALLAQVREQVLAKSMVDEANFNLLEEVAGIVSRDGRADAAGELSELGMRKLPARGRSLDAPQIAGDLSHELARARTRASEQDRELRARWSYDLVRRNCITELARTTDAAFATPEEAAAALGAPASPSDQPFGFVPWVFFDRVRERLRVTRVGYFPARRERELARLLERSPGLETRARESIAYTSTLYTPLPRDGAFLLFTDDVFWRRPAYGAANLLFALGYTGYGLAALPFDSGVRLSSGLSGMIWSVPELALMNVRKGSYDWSD